MAQGRRVGIVYNPRVPQALEIASALVQKLRVEEPPWVCSAEELEGAKGLIPGTYLVITLGGDGTILRTARVVAPLSIPIVGINLGKVGFMTELSAAEALERIDDYVNGEMRIEERSMLEAQVLPRKERGAQDLSFHALNDVVVARGAVSRMVYVDAWVNGAHLTTYRADGVIVATATGSTGYLLSAGGPIVYPWSKDLLIKPIAAHISLSSAVVLHPDAVVELAVQADQQAVLSVDSFVDLALEPGDRVVIKRSPHVTRFLRATPPVHFYQTLTQRLGLGKNADVTRWLDNF